MSRDVKVAVASFLISLMMSGVFVVYYVTTQNQKWCATLTILTRDNPSESPPAQTPFGKRQRQTQVDSYKSLKKQMHDFHCGGE